MMGKNLIILGTITLCVPLFLLLASSSLWQGRIDILEPFPASEQRCLSNDDCALVGGKCGKYACDYPIATKNLQKYFERREAACLPYGARHAYTIINACGRQAYCDAGRCRKRSTTLAADE